MTLDPWLVAEINAEVGKEWNSLPKNEQLRFELEEQTRNAIWEHVTTSRKSVSDEERKNLHRRLVDDRNTVVHLGHFRGAPTQSAAVTRAEGILTLVEAVFSKRVRGEEVGDAVELIHRFKGHRFARALIYMKVATTIFWLFVNSIREFRSSMLGKKAE